MLLFRLADWPIVSLLAGGVRQSDAGVPGEQTDCVEFALTFEHRLFTAFDFRTGFDHEVEVFVADRIIQRDDGGA